MIRDSAYQRVCLSANLDDLLDPHNDGTRGENDLLALGLDEFWTDTRLHLS